MMCTGLCDYYQTFKTFAPNRTYETHKRCTICEHIVDKEQFEAFHCYCCNARYRDRFPSSFETRQEMRQRKRARRKLEILNVITL